MQNQCPPQAGFLKHMWDVYVLKSLQDEKCYTGYTNDIVRRLKEHNSGHTKSLKRRRPLVLIYRETYSDKILAQRRERFFKSGKGREWLKRLLSARADAHNGIYSLSS